MKFFRKYSRKEISVDLDILVMNNWRTYTEYTRQKILCLKTSLTDYLWFLILFISNSIVLILGWFRWLQSQQNSGAVDWTCLYSTSNAFHEPNVKTYKKNFSISAEILFFVWKEFRFLSFIEVGNFDCQAQRLNWVLLESSPPHTLLFWS